MILLLPTVIEKRVEFDESESGTKLQRRWTIKDLDEEKGFDDRN
jgi:hypothetical protein